jgi:hypothetical protein
MRSTPARAASNEGTGVLWPSLWPADEASGREGDGGAGSGLPGAAERWGLGAAFAICTRGRGASGIGAPATFPVIPL